MERALPELPEPPSSPQVPDASIPRTTDNTQRHRIERIKRYTPIADVVARYVKLSKFGERFTGLCPFHPDRNPSLVVFPETGTFHCFGCSKHGDVITFLREIEGLGFREALDRLDSLESSYEPQTPQTK
jgi:DNA primase